MTRHCDVSLKDYALEVLNWKKNVFSGCLQNLELLYIQWDCSVQMYENSMFCKHSENSSFYDIEPNFFQIPYLLFELNLSQNFVFSFVVLFFFTWLILFYNIFSGFQLSFFFFCRFIFFHFIYFILYFFSGF